jgi:hypothetical protein
MLHLFTSNRGAVANVALPDAHRDVPTYSPPLHRPFVPSLTASPFVFLLDCAFSRARNRSTVYCLKCCIQLRVRTITTASLCADSGRATADMHAIHMGNCGFVGASKIGSMNDASDARACCLPQPHAIHLLFCSPVDVGHSVGTRD